MKKAAICLALSMVAGFASAQSVCNQIAGAAFVADDGTFLGSATSKYSLDSVLNEYGDHGSKYSATSIWNEYGNYGGEYATQSPFNKYSATPPRIIKGGQVIGWLTVNEAMSPALNPYVLKTCEFY